MSLDWPFVSVVIPVRNEAGSIGRCLDSVLGQDYPADQFEVLVVDGRSDDETPGIIGEYAARDRRVRMLDNPAQTRAPALNLGVTQARGEVIVRVDGHCWLAPDYLRQSVLTLRASGADTVGGPMRPLGETRVGQTVGLAMTSRFGVGDARFHYSRRPEFVDTVYLGAYRRQTLARAGPFDPAVEPNEDYEVNWRIRASGGRVFLSPDIRSWYTPRDSLPALARQYFRYGSGRFATLRKHPRSLRPRQLAAPALVATLAGSALAGLLDRRGAMLFWLAVGGYLAANLAASTWLAAQHGWRHLRLLPLVFATQHLAWGAGFWVTALRAISPLPRLRGRARMGAWIHHNQ
jgi:succinoglycan biosynthesis protein ExoA